MRTLAIALLVPLLLVAVACGGGESPLTTPDTVTATVLPSTPTSPPVDAPAATQQIESPTAEQADAPSQTASEAGETPTTDPPPPIATPTAEPVAMKPQAQVYFVHAEW